MGELSEDTNLLQSYIDKKRSREWWDSLRNTRLVNGTKDKGYYTDDFFGYNMRMWKYLSEEDVVNIWEYNFKKNNNE